MEKFKALSVKIGGVSAASLAMVLAVAGPSFAAVDPAVVTAVTGGFDDVKALLTGTLIPALFALVLIGIAVRVALRYIRRGSAG